MTAALKKRANKSAADAAAGDEDEAAAAAAAAARRSFSATSILSNETAEKSYGRLVNKPPASDGRVGGGAGRDGQGREGRRLQNVACLLARLNKARRQDFSR